MGKCKLQLVTVISWLETLAALLSHCIASLWTSFLCAFLQDGARSFAGSASDDKKFQLYMAATGFDVMMRQMAASEAEVKQMMEKYQELDGHLEVSLHVCSWMLNPTISLTFHIASQVSGQTVCHRLLCNRPLEPNSLFAA